MSAATLWAQKAPEVGYVFPVGVAAGATTEVRLGGYDWTPDMQFFVSDERVELEVLSPPGPILVPPPPYWFGPKGFNPALPIPREIHARITVPAGVAPGPVRWRVANANGGSTQGLFYVGSGSQIAGSNFAGSEIVEDERSARPQDLPELPLAVSGRIDRIEDVDRYRIRATRTGLITCDLWARRLGSNFHGALAVHNASGRLVADAIDTQGADTSLTFAAQENGEYVLSVRDLDFRGDWAYVYRLEIAAGPRVVAAVPAAGRRGETRNVEFIGWGVETGQAILESTTRTVSFPTEEASARFNYSLDTAYGQSPPFQLAIGNFEERVEPAPGGALAPIDGPCAVTGRIDGTGADTYDLLAKQGEAWSISVQARALGSPLDVVVQVLGADGVELVKCDDLPDTTDAHVDFTPAADGAYRVVVEDVSGRGGTPDATYRIEFDRSPGFRLKTIELLNITIGGTAELPLTLTRSGGFSDAVSIQLVGLPEGVNVPADLVIPPGQAELKIALTAAADAPALASQVIVVGSANINGAAVTEQALSPVAANLAPRGSEESLGNSILVSTVMKPRSRVTPVDNDGGRTVHRGTTYPAPVIVERLEGFEGEVVLQMAARQDRHRQGIDGADVVVPPGVGLAHYPVFLPEWLETSRTSRMILIAVTQAPDLRGTIRYLVSPMDGRITMSIEGALLKIAHAGATIEVSDADAFDIPLRVLRSAKLPEAAVVELLPGEELAGLLSAEPLRLEADQSEAVLRVHASADPRLTGIHNLTVRATARQQGHLKVVSEVTVSVEFAADR